MKSYKLNINGQKYEAKIVEFSEGHAKVEINGNEYFVEIEDDTISTIPKMEKQAKAMPVAPQMSLSAGSNFGNIKAPLPGVIVSVPVKEGDFVRKGDTIIILEAMKMESEIASPISGKIIKIHKREKAPVLEGEILVTIEPDVSEIKALTEAIKPLPTRRQVDKESLVTDSIIRSPLPGTVLEVFVAVGDFVKPDQKVLVLEAMKMESEIHSLSAGKVVKVNVNKGAAVNEGDTLIELET